MEKIGASSITWSPLLQKIATNQEVSTTIAGFLTSSLAKKDLQEEISLLLANHIGYLTPSTIWLLRNPQFKLAKGQQHTRLKVSFAIHDCATNSDCSKLVNLAAILKSPVGLIDIFLKAIIRTK